MASLELIHASCVAIAGRGVLIEGPSGSGKSDLALRLIDRGARLVSDDYCRLSVRSNTLLATAPVTIAGKLEIRGLGIVEVPHDDSAPIALLVTLGAAADRRPERAAPRTFLGIAVPAMVAMDGREASAAIKVERALSMVA